MMNQHNLVPGSPNRDLEPDSICFAVARREIVNSPLL
jgi:hypothetical protein